MKFVLFSLFFLCISLCSQAQQPVLVKDIYTGDEGVIPRFFLATANGAYFSTLSNTNKLWFVDNELNKPKFVHNNCNAIQQIDTLLYFSSRFYIDNVGYQSFVYSYNNRTNELDSMEVNFDANLPFSLDNQIFMLATKNDTTGVYSIDFLKKEVSLVKKLNKMFSIEKSIKDNKYFYFTAIWNSSKQLWRTDGTANGTILLKPFSTNSPYQVFFNDLVEWKNSIYFAANTSNVGHGLWKTDGTAAGTVQIKSNLLSNDARISALKITSKAMIFNAKGKDNKYYYWATDGTAASIKKCNSNGVEYPQGLITQVNDWALFRDNNQIIWKTDGTASDSLLSSKTPNERIDFLFNFKNHAYFKLYKENNELLAIYKTDGQKTTKIDTLNEYLKYLISGAATANSAYLVASEDEYNFEVWHTDGEKNTAYQVADIRLGKGTSNPKSLKPFGNNLLFFATDGKTGQEPWVIDGITQKAKLLINANTSASISPQNRISNFAKTNDRLTFFANDEVNGIELWSSDGTTVGTNLIKNFSTNSASSEAREMTVLDDILYFDLKSDSIAQTICQTDGTTQGTMLWTGTTSSTLKKYGFRKVFHKTKNFLYYYYEKSDTIDTLQIFKLNINDKKSAPILVENIPNILQLQRVYPFQEKQVIIYYVGKKLTLLIADSLDQVEKIEIDSLENYGNEFHIIGDYLVVFYYEKNNTKNAKCFCINLLTKENFTLEVFEAPILIPFYNHLYIQSYIANKYVLFEINFLKKKLNILKEGITSFRKIIGVTNEKILYIASGLDDIIRAFDLNNYNDIIIPSLKVGEYVSDYKTIGRIMYFISESNNGENWLWQTDGTIKNSKKIFNLTSSNPMDLEVVNGVLYFIADDGIHGYELWKFNTRPTKIIESAQIDNFELQVFPNPATDEINIINPSEDVVLLRIYDINGRGIKNQLLFNSIAKIDISSLFSGIYIFEVSIKNKIYYKKVIKK